MYESKLHPSEQKSGPHSAKTIPKTPQGQQWKERKSNGNITKVINIALY